MRQLQWLFVAVLIGAAVVAVTVLRQRNRPSEQWWQQVRRYLSLPALQNRLRSVPALQEAQRALQRQDWTAAEKALRQAVQLDPTNKEAWQLLMMVLARQGRINEAVLLVQRIADPSLQAQALLTLADMSYLQGDFNRADALYRRVLALDPNNATALNNYGYMLAERGIRLDEAERFIRKALSLQPNEPAFWDSLGWVYYQRGNYRQALRYIQRAAQKRPDDPEVRYHLGMVYWRLGDRHAARREFQSALKVDPTYRPAREALETLEQQEMEEEMRGETVRT
ncbi:Beta-barrel assembly-enhancing protease [bacterium HR17]|uniref:Beta-barrel assembly-enhancing protease n=1 Tax=Candidatus Fervidibacter japonicus TaxID=2035412 RepID=A0A2H5X8Y5_9BACT|nr:Beta-barrel assembly-enhancing protease [bacterium HR17]